MASRISPLAMVLCIAAVLALGWVITTMTDPWPPQAGQGPSMQAADLRTFSVDEAPPSLPAPPPSLPVDMPMPPVASRPAPSAGPDIGPTAAPGVAFSYRYAFRLPAERIAGVQEQHARACEQLGIGRCRIVGLRYRVADDRRIEAMLALRLEPAIARRFGRAGTDLVARSEGELIDAEISGTDADRPIRAASRGIAEMREDLRRLEARLAGRLSAEERTRLEYETRQLRQSIRAAEASREEHQESLAGTPMVFQYASGVPAPAGARPQVGSAIARAGVNFVDGVAILFIVAVTLLPWLLLAALLWWLGRIAWRRFGRSFPETAPA